jgi:GNAT superfamily N-acetyltransferase
MCSDREPLLRKLAASDAAAALELSTEAGWNQTENDWRRLFDLSPEGCLAIEIAGEVAATATIVAYERRLAWIGMVLTRKAERGRGFAKRLMNEALHLADSLGIESVKLDATDQGKPIYEKLGFRSEQPVERWECEKVIVPSAALPSTAFGAPVFCFDQFIFGANRSALLQSLAKVNPTVVLDNAYAMTRSGRVSEYLGPSIAETEEAARQVIASALACHAGQRCSWDLLPANTIAVRLAREFDFAPKRHLTRMVRGNELRGNEQQTYALAGFEFG